MNFLNFYAPGTPALIFLCWTPAWSERPRFLCWDCQLLLCFPVNVKGQLVTVLYMRAHILVLSDTTHRAGLLKYDAFTLQHIGISWRVSAVDPCFREQLLVLFVLVHAATWLTLLPDVSHHSSDVQVLVRNAKMCQKKWFANVWWKRNMNHTLTTLRFEHIYTPNFMQVSGSKILSSLFLKFYFLQMSFLPWEIYYICFQLN